MQCLEICQLNLSILHINDCNDVDFFPTVYVRPAAQDHREKLREILHSQKAQYAIVILVVLDMIIVIAELLLDLRAIKGECRHICCCQCVLSFLCNLLHLPDDEPARGYSNCICCTCSV